MIEIYKNLYIGNDSDCIANYNKLAIIHACKTCHQKALNYSKSLPSSHPNYLIYENENNLFLNLVDMPKEFMPRFTDPIMKKALEFIDININEKQILIHCNQGFSRSPSIGLLWLAINNHISNDSYDSAIIDFKKLYPIYQPSAGIYLYLKNNWTRLMELQTENYQEVK